MLKDIQTAQREWLRMSAAANVHALLNEQEAQLPDSLQIFYEPEITDKVSLICPGRGLIGRAARVLSHPEGCHCCSPLASTVRHRLDLALRVTSPARCPPPNQPEAQTFQRSEEHT